MRMVFVEKVFQERYIDNKQLEIMESIVSFILCFILCMAICNVCREIFTFVKCYVKEEEYKTPNSRMYLLWASLSYIITIIIFGI